jgi:hypothetical protein
MHGKKDDIWVEGQILWKYAKKYIGIGTNSAVLRPVAATGTIFGSGDYFRPNFAEIVTIPPSSPTQPR